MRARRQHDAMPWSSFATSSADLSAVNGYRMIGRVVRERRRRLGISQQVLGRLSGVDQSVISRLENGKLVHLRWSRFAAIVETLGGLDVVEGERADHV
jgi:ribosome-binding protein aMBF1 (putative translation factor)